MQCDFCSELLCFWHRVGWDGKPQERIAGRQQGHVAAAQAVRVPLLLGRTEQNLQRLHSQRQHPQQVQCCFKKMSTYVRCQPMYAYMHGIVISWMWDSFPFCGRRMTSGIKQTVG